MELDIVMLKMTNRQALLLMSCCKAARDSIVHDVQTLIQRKGPLNDPAAEKFRDMINDLNEIVDTLFLAVGNNHGTE